MSYKNEHIEVLIQLIRELVDNPKFTWFKYQLLEILNNEITHHDFDGKALNIESKIDLIHTYFQVPNAT